jgi:hypothetical protein
MIAGIVLSVFCGLVDGADVELPEMAIPGLRYYYPASKHQPRTVDADVCIYGGTSGGVVAAIQARRMGKSVILLEFGKHVGGLTTGGLSHTDGGGASVCGGLAREFYNRAGQANFRPSSAEQVYRDMLAEAGVQVEHLCHLDQVHKEDTRITSIVMEDGLEVKARQFIDCTYEGDLMARAKVSFTFGREANSQYNETYNGIRTLGTGGHEWPKDKPVNPYVIAGDPSSGLLPRVSADTGVPGEGDRAIQAFCFRMRLVKDANRLPFPKPTVYDLQQYELLARLFETGADPRPQFTIDTNNHHLFAGTYFIDYVGGNYAWPDADWITRERIFQDHANYQVGVMYFLTHSDRIPQKWRDHFRQFGLPADEYHDTSGWTHQLYIREGRRMVSDYVMTQHNCQGRVVPEDSIGLASYNMDSHHCQMGVVNGAVRNEGNVEIRVNPYPIAYRAITPRQAECTNLLVPVALSSTHIAFGSIRMEPVFMILGQSAATAAVLAIDADIDVQNVGYPALKQRLLADGQILQYTGPLRNTASGPTIIDPKTLDGITIDSHDAQRTGEWIEGAQIGPYIANGYHHDGNRAKGQLTARFESPVKPGRYEVRLAYPVHPNRATNVPVAIHHAEGTKTVLVNQRQRPKVRGILEPLGTFRFDGKAVVEVSTKGTDGYVLIDAVQLVPVE